VVKKKQKIYLTDEALQDLNLLTGFYKKLMFKFAKNLVLEIDETLKSLQRNPHAFDQGYNGKIGIITLRKYPVEIFYTLEQNKIIVLAIQHKNHSINYWINRV